VDLAGAMNITAEDMIASAEALRNEHPDLVPTDGELALLMGEIGPAYLNYAGIVSAPDHAASLETSALLLYICRKVRARRVLDLGSGFSSFVLRAYAHSAHWPVTVVSVDTDPEWLAKTAEFLDGRTNVPGELITWDEFNRRADWEPFDVIFHDLANGETREGAVPWVCRLVAENGVVIFDDAHHDGHREAFWKFGNANGLDVYSAHVPTFDAFGRFAALGVRGRRPSMLAALYVELCETESDIYLHLPTMVELVEQLGAKHVIELGTRTGVSTVAWLYGLEQTGGRLTSVDLDAKPNIGDWPHWTFIQGDDVDPAVVSQLEPADIVFVDTSHLLEHTRKELATYRWLVKPGGVICLHDTEVAHPEGAPADEPPFPVRKAVDEFVQQNGYRYMNIRECNGFGIIKIQ